MCYAIPGKVIELKDKIAAIEYFGEHKKAINEIDGLKVGDYIYAQGGYVIKHIPTDEAISILTTFKETFFELQELDLRLSKMDLEKAGVDKKLTIILDKALEGIAPKEKDLLYLMNLAKPAELQLLYKTANFLRQKHLSNSCCVHGIIEYSNYCSQDCRYCGISKDNKKIKRYRMSKEEILSAAKTSIEKYGFQALVLQGGEDPAYSADDLAGIVREIKKNFAVLIFISSGEFGIEGLQKIYDAGARGLLMRFETGNPALYKKLHPMKSLDNRLEHIRAAFKIGYLIVTGGLIGLPGQTREDIVKDILLTKSLNTEMYTFGPFLPHPESKLANSPPPKTDEILKTIAIARLVDPENAKILVTTGFETLDKKAREQGLMAGANSVMLNVTPDKFKADYEIYPNRAHQNESIAEQIETSLHILRSMGRSPTDLGINR